MKKIVFMQLVLLFSSFTFAGDFNIESFSQELGTNVSSLKAVEQLSKVRLEKMCKEHGCAELEEVFDSCRNHGLFNTCVMTNFYTQAMVLELCDNDIACMKKHYRSEQKFISFYQEKAAEPGFGRLAVNVCSPLHKFHTTNEKLLEIEGELGIVEAFTIFYDFTAYFECISETYKKSVLKSLN
ncbi:hypothetical protein L2755_19485 [Shewanella abyssi]|uniref:hypothetical protein n=1 Tax=Shewanella abyssi TaxID=311789 RepID=UPI00200F215B|nr:hypothetical protein [Shewanella abyssi]MCL1051792.1 hypothetical protein [Shewanella abyssi]